MPTPIEQDHERFRKIVRGKLRSNLRKYISHGEMFGRQGKDVVSIPIPQLDVPRFKYGKNGSGGVGQGDGEPGDPVAADPQPGSGAAGSDPGAHVLEVDVTLEELADVLGEELELPRIEPRGESNVVQDKTRYNSIRRVGPESLRHFKRTYVQALKRQIASGQFTPGARKVIPFPEDARYRSWTTTQEPIAQAAVIYMMDVSGSMTDEQKAIVRTEAFWIDLWIARHYEGVETRYVIHDAAAKEVDREAFFSTRESGGTRISSAYAVAQQLIEQQFPPADWNLYCFHFSDGDNWGEDNSRCLEVLAEQLLPAVNLFGYGQVESPYGSGEFLRTLESTFAEGPSQLVLSEISSRDDIVDSIKTFLGAGR